MRLLGRLLGDELREQVSQELFDRVEEVRRLAKQAAASESSDAVTDSLHRLLTSLPVDEMAKVARAFATFLRLANIAEQHHRVRRRRTYGRQEHGPHQRGSFEEIFARLARSNIDAQTIRDTAARMRIELVLTAHPTEVMRRTTRQADACGRRARGGRPTRSHTRGARGPTQCAAPRSGLDLGH